MTREVAPLCTQIGVIAGRLLGSHGKLDKSATCHGTVNACHGTVTACHGTVNACQLMENTVTMYSSVKR